MKLTLSIFFTIILSTSSIFAQNKLILKKGVKKKTIWEGKLISFTTLKDTTKTNWKFYCRRDSSIIKSIWTVDKIYKDSMVLKQAPMDFSAYQFDTLTYKDYNNKIHSLQKNGWMYHKMLGDEKNFKNVNMIIKKPLFYIYTTLHYNEINSLIFARASKCDTPGLVLFAGPIIMLASTISSFDDGDFNVTSFVIGNGVGIAVTLLAIDLVKTHLVKEYHFKNWAYSLK